MTSPSLWWTPQGPRALLRRLLAGGIAAALLVQTSACTLVRFDQRSVYQFDHHFAVTDAAFPRSLSAFGFAMVGGNRAEILNNGDEIFPAMTAAIREAKFSGPLLARMRQAGVKAAMSDPSGSGASTRSPGGPTARSWSSTAP